MKHSLQITILLALFFLLSQFTGLFIVEKSINFEQTLDSGQVTFNDLPYDIERPPVDENTSYIYIIVAIIIGTLLVLLLMRLRKPKIWKVWYLLSVIFTISISLSTFINQKIAFLIGLIAGLFKVFKPNVIVHNVTELFIYAGIAIIFVPIMNNFAVTMLLILISIYDMYAVWKSKHMIKLANFQTETKVFAGLSFPYNPKKIKSTNKSTSKKHNTKQKKYSKKEMPTAILGGGDIAFPLIFAGVLLKTYGIALAMLVSTVTSVALLGLLLAGKKGRFYPAMPFISIGCFLGWGLISLIA